MILQSETETLALGRQLGIIISSGDKISLTGSLGAGKTTFARGVLQGLGFEDEVPSPTFAIVQQYEPPEVRMPLAHVDFYRIDHREEIRELGLDDILIDGAIIAEWPDRMPAAYWDDALQLTLKIEEKGKRQLTWKAGSAWKERWPLT
ncbi:tRNA threonylcarbamoyladenosine biosynthesis protein TsaE [hydrothermal vent metagenome]|uniref:tRNA threonylcarbamoyladenosine biosynthesis protein TsaE n=1 Tax=hydrothermal vent metagenome TaxID=652676 RepID=A0A3B0SC30_9ZZZZ